MYRSTQTRGAALALFALLLAGGCGALGGGETAVPGVQLSVDDAPTGDRHHAWDDQGYLDALQTARQAGGEACPLPAETATPC